MSRRSLALKFAALLGVPIGSYTKSEYKVWSDCKYFEFNYDFSSCQFSGGKVNIPACTVGTMRFKDAGEGSVLLQFCLTEDELGQLHYITKE